jgi:transcriptional regulator GlxA family with amidase domain
VSRARHQELPEGLGAAAEVMGNHTLPHEVRRQAAVAFCVRLCEAGVVTHDLAARAREPLGESVQRVFTALASLYSTHDTGAQLEVLAALAKISARQATRDMMQFLTTFPLPGKTFREVLKVLRLRRATLLLSCDEVTVKSVAKDVGYGSVDAMARGFRDAGLPSPHEVRALLVPTG